MAPAKKLVPAGPTRVSLRSTIEKMSVSAFADDMAAEALSILAAIMDSAGRTI